MRCAVFIGHNECFGVSTQQLNNAITDCIKNGITTFISGGQGGFDRLCATSVYKFKEKYPQIKNILVIPYLSFNIFDKTIFDEVIFPPEFEKYHFKSAIPKRNRYMIDISDAAICFIDHNWGNAVKTYEYAKKKKLKIVNLAKNSISF